MKEVLGIIKLQVSAGSANPAPPVGPALGQRGLNIMEFCNQFNKLTAEMNKGDPVPVEISYYRDKSFVIKVKTSPASFLIKKYAKIPKGAKTTGKEKVGSIKMQDIKEIAKIKMVDLNANDIDAAAKMIVGTARSMGVEVIE